VYFFDKQYDIKKATEATEEETMGYEE